MMVKDPYLHVVIWLKWIWLVSGKDHTTFSLLLTHEIRSNKLYSSYPNKACTIESVNPNSSVLDKFHGLQHTIDKRMLENNIVSMFDLFNWLVVELHKQHNFAASGQRQIDKDKNYRHL